MKLMKLLLIGLLSVGVLLACEANGTHLPDKKVLAPPLAIVGITNKLPPELFQNVIIKIRAIDKNGNTVKSATWEATGLKDAEMGEVTADGTIALKVTSADAKGTITAKAKIGSENLKAEYIIVASKTPLKSLYVSPKSPYIAIYKPKPVFFQLNAVAVFGSTKIDATNDVVWTMDTHADISISNDAATKGFVTVSKVVDNITATAELTSGTAVLLDNTSISSIDQNIKEIKIVGVQPNITLQNGTVIQLSALAYFSIKDNITFSAVNLTNDVDLDWSSKLESVATISNTNGTDDTLADKGLLTIVGIDGTTTITVSYPGGFTSSATITASAPYDRITAFTVETPATMPSVGNREFVLKIRETTVEIGSPTSAESRLYTCTIKGTGTGIVLIDGETTCDKLKTGTKTESLQTTIEVTNTLQPLIEAQTVVITPKYEEVTTAIQSFTVVAPADNLLTKPSEKIELIIMEKHDIGNLQKGVLTNYTCTIEGEGTGVVLVGGTTCDNLKTGTAIDMLETVVKITYTVDLDIPNTSGNITIKPVYKATP